MPTTTYRILRACRRRVLALCAALSTILTAGQAISGQGLTLDAPTEIERARAKADKALEAWAAQSRVESRVFAMPPDQAIAEVRRDSRLYDEYLAARQRQISLLSQVFRQHAQALAASSVRPDFGKLSEAARQDLTALLEGDLGTGQAMAAAEKDPDPGRRAARRQAVEREAEAYKQLEEDARKRLELAELERQSSDKFDRNEQALTDLFRRLAASLGEDADSYSRERLMWRTYAQDLEDLILQKGSVPGAVAEKPKPAKGRKPAQAAGRDQ
jgi:hypothetical protein